MTIRMSASEYAQRIGAKPAPVKRAPSDGEKSLARQLADGIGLDHFVREHRFHPKRRWRFDFAWLPEMLAVEVEGGVFSRGRHTRGSGFVEDCEKYAEAAILGWTVIRVPTSWATSGKAFRLIVRWMEARDERSKR